ncbi:MAG: 4-hydroxy-3-methylbut-2-enyl diphosphate reductase [Bacteroidaceae bacterium]|nr:4-hydroxy-3-methylbut-2-enyl diphosphate reductase [Bacteroidaceae bacterium]
MTIEIDRGSGFCFGVTRAISKAEEELARGELYCLGDIVHNGRECERLSAMGLRTIGHDDYGKLRGARVLLRAHGEPPATYEYARRAGIELIDATCPVVLHLQERIKNEVDDSNKQIVIFGKKGHAEVVGLVGQTDGRAIVIEHLEDAERLDFTRDICLYSQTTKSLEDFHKIIDYIKENISEEATFRYYDTICRQVSSRMEGIRQFAGSHDVCLFVSGTQSSNGKVLFGQCKEVNPRTHQVADPSEIRAEWFEDCESVGICGATSTPGWLMQECKVFVEELFGGDE